MKNSFQILKQFGYIPILIISIRSKSNPDEWHKVKYFESNGKSWWECDCMGYATRKHCRHIDKAIQLCQNNQQN